MVEWMLLPTRSAIGRTPARSCTSISPRWYFALTSYLALRPHLLLLLFESCLRQSGRRATPPTMAPPSPPRPPPPAKRKGARRLLRVATVRSRSRRACASAPHTTCRKGPPIPQARVAPAPDLRLLGKRSLSLLRMASAQTTRTRLRSEERRVGKECRSR